MSIWDFFRRRRLEVCSLSDAGSVRKENQDAFFIDPEKTVFCVADGMGGGEGGAAASAIVVSEISKALSRPVFAERVEDINRAIASANSRIREYAERENFSVMATTVALLALDPGGGPRAAVANVGDSRVYRRRKRRLECLSVDHRAGALSNFLTRAVGADKDVEVDWREVETAAGDIFLVCSDGVSDMLGDSTLNAVLALGGSAADIAERISVAVRRAGARDNFTLAVLRT